MYYILFLETFSSFDFRTPISPLPSYSKTSCWVFAVPPSSRHSKYQRAPRLSPQLSSSLYSTDFLGYLTRCHIFLEHLHTDYSHTYTSGLDLSHELQVHVSHCLLNIYTWSLTGISALAHPKRDLLLSHWFLLYSYPPMYFCLHFSSFMPVTLTLPMTLLLLRHPTSNPTANLFHNTSKSWPFLSTSTAKILVQVTVISHWEYWSNGSPRFYSSNQWDRSKP